ncbi:MAG: hypothetical protein RL139_669 [Gemmatimonadota bacterium]
MTPAQADLARRLVCTCRRGQACHLDWLGVHLVRAGHVVIGRNGSALP